MDEENVDILEEDDFETEEFDKPKIYDEEFHSSGTIGLIF